MRWIFRSNSGSQSAGFRSAGARNTPIHGMPILWIDGVDICIFARHSVPDHFSVDWMPAIFMIDDPDECQNCNITMKQRKPPRPDTSEPDSSKVPENLSTW